MNMDILMETAYVDISKLWSPNTFMCYKNLTGLACCGEKHSRCLEISNWAAVQMMSLTAFFDVHMYVCMYDLTYEELLQQIKEELGQWLPCLMVLKNRTR
jgi:hypothetical protein